MDVWRAAYKGIVPDAHLDGLSCEGSEHLWRDVITAGDGCVFVAENENGVFGFASGQRRRRFSQGLRDYEGELKTIYVLPNGQGTGVGKQLMGAVARHLADRGVGSMLLWVFAGNHRARGFYESLGGVVIAEGGFELAGAWIREVAYGWRDLDVLLARTGDAQGI